MKIRALANGNVIDAHPDEAKILIENKIYEAVSDEEPQSSEHVSPQGSVAAPPKAAAPPKRRTKRAK